MLTIVPFLQQVNALILNPLIGLLFAISTVYFFYGVVKFLSLEAGDKARDEARSSIIWGMVGMLIMFSVYGIIGFVLNTFQVNKNDVQLIGNKIPS